MKKFLLGISLFFGGIIGFVGWIISNAIIFNGLTGIGFMGYLNGASELLVLGIFLVMGLVGLFISFLECKKD